MWNFLKETNSRLGDHPRRPTKTNSRLDHDWETWDFGWRKLEVGGRKLDFGRKKPGGAWQKAALRPERCEKGWCSRSSCA